MSVRIVADAYWKTFKLNSANGFTAIHTPHTQSLVAAICDDHAIGFFLHTHAHWLAKSIILVAFTPKSSDMAAFAVEYLHAMIVTVSNNNVTSSSAAYSFWIIELIGCISSLFSTSHREEMSERGPKGTRRAGDRERLQSIRIRHDQVVGCGLDACPHRTSELAILGSTRAKFIQEAAIVLREEPQSIVGRVSDDNTFVTGSKCHS